MMVRMRASVVPSSLAALAAVLVLAACSTGPTAAPTGAASGTPEPSASAAPTTGTDTPVAIPTPTPTPVVSQPIGLKCAQLVTPQAMYDVNPNLALLSSATTSAGTPEAEIQAAKGLVCQWQNTSSNTLTTVAAAKLTDAQLTDAKNDTYEQSQLVPTYNTEGYFAVRDGEGQAVAFQGSYWVVVSSPDFIEPGDAADIMSAALGALK